MIARIIAWCARNRFLVFTGALLLVLAGIWSLHHVPLDALPDISDVQVIIHTRGRASRPMSSRTRSPIPSSLRCSRRRTSRPCARRPCSATLMSSSSFEDGTDLYWARSRVMEYLQQIAGKLPADVHPAIGPDATGAGWVYEYAIVDRSHTKSLADLRALQDWYLRYQLETVPGVAEVASIGGFVRQYQVNLDPQKLFAYGIPPPPSSTAFAQSTNEVGGDVLEMSGAEYMVRGLGYLRSLSDLENVPVATKNGTPVLIRDLGTVSFGPDVRRGAADWQGEGETVGGIVVMRYGMNALNVIDGVKAKLKEIAPSLPPGVEIVTGYDRSWLINQSIHTLKRDLIVEAIIVSFVSIVFLFHFRSALVPILTCPSRCWPPSSRCTTCTSARTSCRWADWRWPIGVLVDAAIVMVENGYRHLAERNATAPIGEAERRRILVDARSRSARRSSSRSSLSWCRSCRSFCWKRRKAACSGRWPGPRPWRSSSPRCSPSRWFRRSCRSVLRGKLRPESKNPVPASRRRSICPFCAGACVTGRLVVALNLVFLAVTIPLYFQPRQPVHAGAVRRLLALHAERAARHLDHPGHRAHAGAGPHHPLLPRSGNRLRHRGPLRQRHRQCAARYVRHHRHAQAPRAMAPRHDLRKADPAKWTRSSSFRGSPTPGPCPSKTASTWS